jgi:hypothetical protein
VARLSNKGSPYSTFVTHLRQLFISVVSINATCLSFINLTFYFYILLKALVNRMIGRSVGMVRSRTKATELVRFNRIISSCFYSILYD